MFYYLAYLNYFETYISQCMKKKTKIKKKNKRVGLQSIITYCAKNLHIKKIAIFLKKK